MLEANNNEIDAAILQGKEQEKQKEEKLFVGNDISLHPGPAKLEEMSFDERIAHLKKTVTRHPLHRELHYKTLIYCCERHILPDVENFIATCPEFPSADQSPYFLLRFLVQAGGIDAYELDEAGRVITQDQKEGLSEDEIDDLIYQFAYETNEVGRELIRLMSPSERLQELFDLSPEHYDTYIELLDFLTEKRSFAHVDNLLRGRDALMAGREAGDRPLQASVFVDKLERAGAIYWEGGWLITPEGREVLETLKERKEL